MIFDTMLLSFLPNKRGHVRIENDRKDFRDYLCLQHSDSSYEQGLRHFGTDETRADDRDRPCFRFSEIIRESFHVIHSSDRKPAIQRRTRNVEGGRAGACREDEIVILKLGSGMILRLELHNTAVGANLCRSNSEPEVYSVRMLVKVLIITDQRSHCGDYSAESVR